MFKSLFACALPLMATTLMMPGTSDAAQRRVMAEQFTATWCTYCPSVGRAMMDLMMDYPDSIISYQCHGGDSYTVAWGNSRLAFYGVAGYPDAWLDGWWEQYGSMGSDSANYNNLLNGMNSCLARSTDVSIVSSGEETSNNQYKLTYDITVDADASPMTMKLNIIQTLDVYPAGDHYYNCLVQGNNSPTITVNPGETYQHEQTFVLSGASLTDKENVNYLAWLQNTNTSGPAQTHNSDLHGHGQLPPTIVTVGDGGEYNTIGEAIDGVGQYSTIHILPGIYYEILDFNGKNLILKGTEGAEATIIDGNSIDTVITLMNGENSNMVLEGLTIQNGYNTLGSGIRCNGTPQFIDCIIRNNQAQYVVGGISSADSGGIGPYIAGCHFCDNDFEDIFGPWENAGDNSFADVCDDNPVCPGDYDENFLVNVSDLLIVIQEWNNPYTVNELLEVIANWGNDCL